VKVRNAYWWLGWGLIGSGASLGALFYFVLQSVPLTAVGMSMVILGAVCLALSQALPKVPPEASALLLQTGLENIASLIEELGLRSKAIYLPSSLAGGKPQALIPLHSNPALPRISAHLPRRLVVKYGANPEDMGLLVTTAGSTALAMLGYKPGASVSELEASLSSILSGTLDVADGVNVAMAGDRVSATISHPRLEYDNIWLYQCLGSPLASVAAAVAAEALGKPIVIEQETRNKDQHIVEMKVQEGYEGGVQ
jgi:hypothetical protein